MGKPFNLSEGEFYEGEEKREYLRLPFEYPLKYTACRKGLLKDLQIGTAQNVSQSGLLFRAKKAPAVGAIILIETDLKTLSNCIEVENSLIELNGRLMGKVVRIEPSDGLHEIAVQFVRIGEEEDRDVARAIQTASEFASS